MLYPLTMFCCGCTIPVGASCIVFSHLALSILYVVSICSNVIFHTPLFASAWSIHMQLLYVAFCLVGIPIMCGALWGVYKRIETNVRVYLYYLGLCFLVDVCGMVYFCLIQDPCSMVGNFIDMTVENFGEAFLCGVFRILSYIVVAVAVVVEAYCLWVIWSLCEDVH